MEVIINIFTVGVYKLRTIGTMFKPSLIQKTHFLAGYMQDMRLDIT